MQPIPGARKEAKTSAKSPAAPAPQKEGNKTPPPTAKMNRPRKFDPNVYVRMQGEEMRRRKRGRKAGKSRKGPPDLLQVRAAAQGGGSKKR